MEPLIIASEALQSDDAQRLIAALDAESQRRYPEPGMNHFRLDAEEVAAGRGAFLVARYGSTLAGCGALRRIEPGVGELKRMYVVPALRGRGVGGALLAALEREARALVLTRLVLETGERQPEALALYRRAGFLPIGRFGEYRDGPLSLCFGKAL
jgi:putative acetyltransferase